MAAVAERYESYVAAFEAFRHDPAFAGDPKPREAAFRRFLDAGFPTTRDEEWQFTNVAPVAATTFGRPAAASLSHADIGPFLIAGVPAIVLVNGRLSKELSNLDALPQGIAVKATHESQGNTSTGAFADLNAAFFEQIVAVTIEAKAIVETPVHLLSITVASGHAALVAPRFIVHAGEQSQGAVVEDYVSLGEGAMLTTAVTDILLAPGAVVDHVKIQRESASIFHLSNTKIHQGRGSTFASRAITVGGRIARNDIGAALRGEGAECTLNGLYIASGDRLVDTHTTIEHSAPHCPSHEVYKGILAGRSRAVFNGKIIVDQIAQKTDAKQTNKALLLSDNAQINTKPQLEIFADDVKCTHGAAIGQLDEDALFYLRAHGIAETDARHMLIEAFAGEVLDGIRHEAVRQLARTLLQQLLSRDVHA